MADKELHDFTAVSVPALTDVHFVNQSSTALKETTAQMFTLINSTNIDFVSAGWKADVNTWTAVSGSFDANFPNFVFTIAADASTYLYVGQKIKYTQTTVKYGVIVKVAYSSPNTTVTVYGGGTKASPSYEMTSAAITYPYYATNSRPLDFPMGEETWSTVYISTQDCYKYAPDGASWYGGASAWTSGSAITPYFGIGLWNVKYDVTMYKRAWAGNWKVTLSSSNNAESISKLTAAYFMDVGNSQLIQTGRSADIILTTSTQHWLLGIITVNGCDYVRFRGDVNPTVITAKCLYV
jgi:hypothetical protein